MHVFAGFTFKVTKSPKKVQNEFEKYDEHNTKKPSVDTVDVW